MISKIVLEPEAKAFAEATTPPFLFQLGPEKGRLVFDERQSDPRTQPPVNIQDFTIKNGPSGNVSVHILRPQNASAVLPVVMYIHGAGWVFGNEHTHARLIREIAVGAKAAVVFPEYSLSPESKYPTDLEENYAVLRWIANHGKENGLDPQGLAVAGDSAGGNLTAALTLIAKERGSSLIQRQLLFYPVTNAMFDTESYYAFAGGYHLRRDAMIWFWDQYTTNPKERNEITASPLRASTEQLRNLPAALVITAESDVLRDEGEAYANKLRQAGVYVTAVRFQGTIHDFLMLNALRNSAAARGAMFLATAWLRDGFATG